MKYLLSLTTIFTFCLLFSGCAKKYKVGEMPEEKIVFGSGGGFSGYVTEYTLLKNGQLFEKKDPNPEVIELPSITKKRAESLFIRCEDLKIPTMDFKAPDNFTYFIKVTTKEHNNKITWGNVENPISEEIEQFFKQLKNTSVDNKNIQ